MKIIEYYKKKAAIIDDVKNNHIYEYSELSTEAENTLIDELKELDKEYGLEKQVNENDYNVIIDSLNQYLLSQEDDSYS